MKQIEALVLSRLLAHGGCPVLGWMTANVTAKMDAKDNIYPTKEFSENKIDGMVALIMAMSRTVNAQSLPVIDSNYRFA
jgi:phage terminase large subunit-like protein